MSVYIIPPKANLKIPIGDDYYADLTLESSPGGGTFLARIKDRIGAQHDFVVASVSGAVLVQISMASGLTALIEPGNFTWSLLYRDDITTDDLTIAAGGGVATSYPTSGLEP